MSATVVNRNLRHSEIRVCKRPNGNAHRRIVTVFRMKDSRPADRAEPEYKPASLISGTNVFGSGSGDLVGGGEARQCCEDTARSLLAREAMANSNAAWVALNLDR